jgi:hypothetical protein
MAQAIAEYYLLPCTSGAKSAIYLVHPQRVKAIAAAKLKNDRVDSATLAHLLRCNLRRKRGGSKWKPASDGSGYGCASL